MFIKAILIDSKNVKINRNYVPNWNLCLYFFIYQNLVISDEKVLMSVELNWYDT